MYKVQYKKTSPYQSWTTVGSYGTEAQAINIAISYKNKGMILVRVTDKKGHVVYSN